MKLPKIFNLKKFTRISGKLLPITFNNKFPIKVKRIFIIYGKKNHIRGDHAHKRCSQVFFPIMVLDMDPRSIVELHPISALSLIITIPI